MTTDALAAYKEAVALEPGEPRVREGARRGVRADARVPRGAQSSTRRSPRSAKEKGDKALARECRTRIVTLWGLERIARAAAARAATAVRGDAARPRGGAHARRGAAPPAPAAARPRPTLRRVIELAPGDAESYLALERVLVQESKIADAIAVLERARAGGPEARARALPAHGAVRAADLRRRRRDQVRGARRRAEPGRRRGPPAPRRDVPVEAGRRARDRRVSRRHREERPPLRRVLRARGSAPLEGPDRRGRSPVPASSCAARRTRSSSRARRASRCRSTWARARSSRSSRTSCRWPSATRSSPIYRRLLVEIYGSLTFGLVQRVTHGTPKEADEARAGARAHRVARGQAAARRARRPGREPAAHRDRRARVRAEPERGAAALRVRDGPRGAGAARRAR